MRSLWNCCRAAILMAALGLLAGCATDSAPKKTVDEDPLSKQARLLRTKF